MTFWGKTDRVAGGLWHPAAFHMLDVAAVADRWLALNPAWVARLALSLGTAPSDLHSATVAMIGLHDLGKFSRAFQCLVPPLWPTAVLGEIPDEGLRPRVRHDAVALALFDTRCGSGVGADPALWRFFENFRVSPSRRNPRGAVDRSTIGAVLAPIVGHHGQPVDPPRDDLERLFGTSAEAEAATFLDHWFAIVQPPALPGWTHAQSTTFAWTVSGLVVFADWLGSGRHFAPKTPVGEYPQQSLAAYWADVAKPTAKQVLRYHDLNPAKVASSSTARTLFGLKSPRPLQDLAETITLPTGPVLIVVEDVTGAGKTEAATILAHRFMRRSSAGGLYVALPTMATANAMFERLRRAVDALFADGERPSIALAHGRRHLNDAFRVRLPEGQDAEHHSVEADCSAWIAEDRRKAFLAQIGVGTIDQALLAILPARYQSLRLFGLSDRVLVIDEAHAYDAYTGKLMETLVRFQAGLGGSVIVLSATLHAAGRQKLLDAFRAGLGAEPLPAEAGRAPYPMMTIAGRDEIRRQKVEPVAFLARHVAVSRLTEPTMAEARLIAAHRAGAAVAYVRNSVQDAIYTAARLRTEGLMPILFHARFAMGDRLTIEKDVVARFGRDGNPVRRRERPLVATQVVEQSLDLDFDLMLSDLAPMDLLLQRAGRVWRHMDLRPKDVRPFATPMLEVVAPDPEGAITAGWIKSALRNTAIVYPDAALLWRTAKVLFSAGGFTTPRDLRDFVERAYAATPEPGLATPPALLPAATRVEGNTSGERTIATQSALVFDDGYVRGTTWVDEAKILTRLGEEMLTLRLARIEGGTVVPWFADADPTTAWALSEVSVPKRRISGMAPTRWDDGVEEVRAGFGHFEKDIPILVLLRSAKDQFEGEVFDKQDRVVKVHYSLASGLNLD